MRPTDRHGTDPELDAQIIARFRESLDAMPVTLPPFAQVLERAQSAPRRRGPRRFPTTLAA
ncbi:MAG: hypothetical protein J2P40_11125, partial [Candidatus Dormibacteraeota bacterium]|nr:hypothetical protein [Candidatus Dormibacteraeota bacterium]MBO0761815.1 hypothetical protein [Candidatus Dormibacteraeota bacterium]